ncbi:MAG: cold shock and DUF1294 domain-containing protein [Burkholderiales bacterium]|nr:cold shock and DUF1294 domain-containing protein [Burkholderiales bacterium]
MRIDGTLKSWNDERGFGFIDPTQGGQEIFVHIKAFQVRTEKPHVGQRLSFEIEVNSDGKKRAKLVQQARIARVSGRRRDSPAQWGAASYFAIPAFLFVYIPVAIVWRVPNWVPALYLAASVVCFVVYVFDKSAAVAGRWRVSESTLIFLGLVGGWPGAIVAQQVLRHKSNKAAFRAAFWGSVVLNVLAFIALSSPLLLLLRV